MSIIGNAESYIKLRGSLSMPEAIHGKSAYEIALAHGFKGTEEEWLASLKGATDGKSAYEIALSHGFKGTEEEWLASLEGKDGKDGKNGKDGEDGIPSGYAPEIWTFTLADGTVVTTKVLTKAAYASFTIVVDYFGDITHMSGTVTSGTTWAEWGVEENKASGAPFDLWVSKEGGYVYHEGYGYYLKDAKGNKILWDSEIIAGDYSLW